MRPTPPPEEREHRMGNVQCRRGPPRQTGGTREQSDGEGCYGCGSLEAALALVFSSDVDIHSVSITPVLLFAT